MAGAACEADFGFALVAFRCVNINAFEGGDEFVYVAVACDWSDFAVFL